MTDEDGGIINDPLILKFNENKFWLSIADSDAILWCKGIAHPGKFNVKISEKREFFETRYDGKIVPVENEAEKLCNKDFELPFKSNSID